MEEAQKTQGNGKEGTHAPQPNQSFGKEQKKTRCIPCVDVGKMDPAGETEDKKKEILKKNKSTEHQLNTQGGRTPDQQRKKARSSNTGRTKSTTDRKKKTERDHCGIPVHTRKRPHVD